MGSNCVYNILDSSYILLHDYSLYICQREIIMKCVLYLRYYKYKTCYIVDRYKKIINSIKSY